jgi:multidrug efflux pump subunit AcrB
MTPRRRNRLLVGALLLAGAALAAFFLYRAVPVLLGLHGGYRAPLVISVQASYPGADAQTVADALAAPIEGQVNGVEHLLSLSSVSTNDGGYTLRVTFAPGTDLDVAQVLVQNRVNLALPALPDVVQKAGVTVRKRAPEPLALVCLTSPGGRYDALYLGNYAASRVEAELARLPGVGDVALFGHTESQLRVWLDPDKLAARDVSAADVVTALREQNVQGAAGAVGQPPVPNGQQLPLTVKGAGRLAEPEQLEGVVVKAAPDGRTVRLKDVARVELGGNEESSVSLDGKPAALLSVHALPNARPSGVSRAVHDKLAELRAGLPDGLVLEVAFDFAPDLEGKAQPATPDHLVIDAEMPEAASAERTAQTLEHAAGLVRQMQGVQGVLSLTEHPFALDRNRPCLVVGLDGKGQQRPDRERIASAVRLALREQVPEAAFRVSVPSPSAGFPVSGFPVEFAVEDRGDHGLAALGERAEALAGRMSRSGKFTDVGVGAGLRRTPDLQVDVDRAKCQALGVDVNEVFNTLQASLGSCYIEDFNQFGRAWRVNVRVESGFRDRGAALRQLRVKNSQGEQVPLGAVVSVRDGVGPAVVERHNLYPVARVTANLAGGVAPGEAKALCEALAEEEFGRESFKLVWLGR